MRILVTGHKGYIGGHLFEALVELGHEVVGIDLKEGHDITHCLPDLNFDYVFHLAWYVEPGKYLNSDKNMDCVLASLKFGKACGKIKG